MELFFETRRADAMSEVTIVIPNWNGMQYLEGCLSSLREQDLPDIDIIVVDNGSTDGSAAYIEEHYPEIRLHCLQGNTGFCNGVNVGIRLCSTEYVILLNNDTKCDPHFAGALLKAIKEKPKAFSCCSRMLQMAHPELIDDAGDYYCALGWAFSDGKGLPSFARTKPHPVFASCAGAAIYRRKLFDEVGYFDPNHFAYLEDIDIGYRAKLAGYENHYVPEAIVYHAGSGASGAVRHSEFKVKYSSRNSVYLIGKNMPLWQIILNLPFLAAGFLIKAVYFSRKGFGKIYRRGVREGMRMALEQAGEGYRRIAHPKFFRVQLELWGNLFRRLKRG